MNFDDALKTLREHTQIARNRRCTWPDNRIGAEYLQFQDHLAEMLAAGVG